MKSLWHWFRQFFTGRPHFIVGGADNPYLLRWYLIPRNPWLNIYLHKFLRDDDDRALHDHPWWFISVMLRGAYREWERFQGEFIYTDRHAPSLAYRSASHAHRVVLPRFPGGLPIPCWTIVVTGPKVREWGFHCPKGWVPWHQFIDHSDEGNIGKGCGGDA